MINIYELHRSAGTADGLKMATKLRQAGAEYHGPTDVHGFPIGTQDDHYDICMLIDLEEYYDEHGVYGFRPSRDVVEVGGGAGNEGCFAR